MANKGAVNMCCKCKRTYKKQVNIYPSCNNNENIHDTEFNPYYHTVHINPEDPPKIVIRKPVMVDPKFIESVHSLMEHIKLNTSS